VKNPNPITRARRIETRRKQLGYPTRCFHCPETDIFCFEEDHPATRELDDQFKRVECRNCHRKVEARRDIKGLTKNGQHDVNESEREALRRYLLLMAEDQDSIAELLQSPNASSPLIANALKSTAASLRRKAESSPTLNWPLTGDPSAEWDGLGCA
jgi:hypothetical protein